MPERVISFSSRKMAAVIVGSCLIFGLGFWIASLDDQFIESWSRFNRPALVHGFGSVLIALSFSCGIFCVWRLFDKSPGLILSDTGVLDNASGISAGFIPWSEVTGVEIVKVQRQRLIVVRVAHPQEYMARGNALRRILLRANYKLCGSPVVISSTALKINLDELLSLFDEYLLKCRAV